MFLQLVLSCKAASRIVGLHLIMLSRDVRVDLYCGMFLSIQSWIPYKAFCVPLSVRA